MRRRMSAWRFALFSGGLTVSRRPTNPASGRNAVGGSCATAHLSRQDMKKPGRSSCSGRAFYRGSLDRCGDLHAVHVHQQVAGRLNLAARLGVVPAKLRGQQGCQLVEHFQGHQTAEGQ